MDGDGVPALDFNDDIEGGRGLSLKDAFLRASVAGFVVSEGDGLDAAYEVGEGGVEDEVV